MQCNVEWEEEMEIVEDFLFPFQQFPFLLHHRLHYTIVGRISVIMDMCVQEYVVQVL